VRRPQAVEDVAWGLSTHWSLGQSLRGRDRERAINLLRRPGPARLRAWARGRFRPGLTCRRFWQRGRRPDGEARRVGHLPVPPRGLSTIRHLRPQAEAPVEFPASSSRIATNVPGVLIGDQLPRLSRVMDKVALIGRSATTIPTQAPPITTCLTGYFRRPASIRG